VSVLNDPDLERRLAALHGRSDAQTADMEAQFSDRPKGGGAAQWPDPDALKSFLADKLVALDRDKAEFCYQLIRAANARRIVEIGTSFGVSTLYLAAAVRDNLAASGGEGVVIGTEYEPEKAAAARSLFVEAGLSDFIELREGDLRETLRDLSGPVDFVLMDIWLPMVAPALERVGPLLRSGAVIIADNTGRHRADYGALFAFLAANDFRTLTLPFDGGLELSVKA
jgi:predicted O-methyltransferase YrrM